MVFHCSSTNKAAPSLLIYISLPISAFCIWFLTGVSKGLITDNHQELEYLGYIKSPFENRILILTNAHVVNGGNIINIRTEETQGENLRANVINICDEKGSKLASCEFYVNQ